MDETTSILLNRRIYFMKIWYFQLQITLFYVPSIHKFNVIFAIYKKTMEIDWSLFVLNSQSLLTFFFSGNKKFLSVFWLNF